MQTMAMTIRKTIEVAATRERAFDVFTSGIAGWWPTDTHSIGEERVADLVLEPQVGGLLFEVLDDGTRHEWADVEAFEPPALLRLNWRVNPRRAATTVEVVFTALGDGRTRVELTHSGFDDPESFESYETGWDPVMERFAAAIS